MLFRSDIFGSDEGTLQGKTTRRPTHNVGIIQWDVPSDVLSRYKTVTLCIDNMFVNRIPMLLTISLHICFRTVHALDNRLSTTMIAALQSVFALYAARGFDVKLIKADKEFEPL